MRSLRTVALTTALCVLAALPSTSLALEKGTARLVSVTPLNGGCVSGPTGATTEAWDIEPGHSYQIRLEDVTECANGGTDPTLNIRVNSSIPGHEYTDLVATNVAPGVYIFNYYLPASAWCTLPILYCTTPGEWLTTGLFVRRHDGGLNPQGVPYTSHLRASTWGPGCTIPTMIPGPECSTVSTEESSWGSVKARYQ